MAVFEKITRRDDPDEIASSRRRNAERLAAAVATASKRARRSSAMLRRLFASAVILDQHEDTKVSVVSFNAPPFRGGLHHFYSWRHLDDLTARELAAEVSQMLRKDVARKLDRA